MGVDLPSGGWYVWDDFQLPGTRTFVGTPGKSYCFRTCATDRAGQPGGIGPGAGLLRVSAVSGMAATSVEVSQGIMGVGYLDPPFRRPADYRALSRPEP